MLPVKYKKNAKTKTKKGVKVVEKPLSAKVNAKGTKPHVAVGVSMTGGGPPGGGTSMSGGPPSAGGRR